ncbi:MAG: hotdog family protein [Acidimicrobiales bacterium]
MTAEARYLDDFVAGPVYELGSHTVSFEEIVRYAGKWDPQSFHTDPTEAAHSRYGGLIASGWHAGVDSHAALRSCPARRQRLPGQSRSRRSGLARYRSPW